MLAALMAGQRWEGREAGSRLVAHPQPQGPQPLAVDQPGAPLPISFPLCVSLFFLPLPPASPPSVTLCVSLVPLTSSQFSLPASLLQWPQ